MSLSLKNGVCKLSRKAVLVASVVAAVALWGSPVEAQEGSAAVNDTVVAMAASNETVSMMNETMNNEESSSNMTAYVSDTDSNATNTADSNETLFDNCSVDDYYVSLPTDVSTWTMEQLQELLTSTHRLQLPSLGSKGEANILTALVDLDKGYDDPEDTVRLYDRDIDFASDKQNTPEGWKRGDLWPITRTATLVTKAGTDVHVKRPADWEVDSELELYFWGECGTVEASDQCVSPAVANQTPSDSATDFKIKTPTASWRGSVARSVLYAALRYGSELGLKLSDCPPFATTDYGYLSALLSWHAEYAVTDQETERNDRACARWQGNRNPLVDYPELAETLFGKPDTVMEGTFSYTKCAEIGIETQSPTATPNACTDLVPGDVSILIFNSDPVDQIVLFPVVDLPASIGSLYVTDKAWNGTDFCTNEGVIEVRIRVYTGGNGARACVCVAIQLGPQPSPHFVRLFTLAQYAIPPEGRKAGRVFGYKVQFPDDTGTWADDTAAGGVFDLSTTQPDNMFVYCLNADDEPHFVHALIYNDAGFGGVASPSTGSSPTMPSNATAVTEPDNNGTAVTSRLDVAATMCEVTTTMLPNALAPNADGTPAKGVLALSFAPNYVYEGVRDGNKAELLAAFADARNYKPSNTPYNIVASSAVVSSVVGCWTMSLVSVVVVALRML
jgi:endonuclease I